MSNDPLNNLGDWGVTPLASSRRRGPVWGNWISISGIDAGSGEKPRASLPGGVSPAGEPFWEVLGQPDTNQGFVNGSLGRVGCLGV